MPDRSYTCAICRGIFAPEWDEEEAVAEMKRDFPGANVEDCDVVCDDCYQAVRPSVNADVFARWLLEEANA